MLLYSVCDIIYLYMHLSCRIVIVLLAICSCFSCHTFLLYLDHPYMKLFNTSLFVVYTYNGYA